MNAFERRLTLKIKAEVPDLAQVAPSLSLAVYQKGQLAGQLRLGNECDFYDLASLTKIIFTASAAMEFFARSKKIHSPIRRVLPWWKAATTPAQLMTHRAGLEWWQPHYKYLKGPLQPEPRWAQLKKRLAKVKPKRATKALYSDLDLWMLGAYLEAELGQSLQQIWQGVCARMELEDLFFNPGNQPRFARTRFAPTERCTWRQKLMQGEVHDENTWALGGVAPHAGLFGSLESVSDWSLKLRAAYFGSKQHFSNPAMVKTFAHRQIPRALGDWGYLFMKPSRPRSSCGRHFSLRSFGHTGFTGTSIWLDPRADRLVVILSNRVYPTRENKAFVTLRPLLHDWICQLL